MKMKTSKKILALLLILMMSSVLLPATAAAVGIDITWYGPDPTPIQLTVMKNVAGGYYFLRTIQFDPVLNGEDGGDVNGCGDSGYDGQFYHWKMTGGTKVDTSGGDAFIAVNRSSVDGKWYVDKWAWNNWVYQPGMYTHSDASFILTSSAPHNGSITVNRSWAAGSTPTDTSFSIYRYTNVAWQTTDKWIFYETVTLPQAQNSLTFSSLFDGQYKIVQNLPQFYSDNYSQASYTTTLSGGNSVTASFTDTAADAYSVGIAPSAGGLITPDKTSAHQGESVSLTISPDPGMWLKPGSLKYNDGSDNAISGTSFTMPGRNVTVSAEFETAPSTEYTVSVAPLTGGSISASPAASTAGGTIDLTITPDAGKCLISSSLKYNDGSDHTISGSSFEMPEHNVTVSAEFKDQLTIAGDGSNLPAGVIGTAYNTTISSANVTAPFSWSATGLPDGLSIDPISGAVSGTPADTGNFTPTITLADANDEAATVSFNLTINETFSIDLTGLSVSPGTLAPAFDKNTVAYGVSAGEDLKSMDITAQTADPAATLSINDQTAASGVVQRVDLRQEANLIPIVVTSPDNVSQKSYILSVNGVIDDADLSGLSINGQTLNPVFDAGTESYNLAVANGTDSLEITAAPHDPRALMVLNGSLLSANTPVSVNLTDGANEIKVMVVAQDASTKTYTININRESALMISSTSLPLGIVNTAYNAALSAAGGTAPYTWTAAELPAGLSLGPDTGVISGTPTVTGSFDVDVTLTDNNSNTASKTLILKLNQGCGNGAFLITPDTDAACTAGLTADGIPTMTVKKCVSGFKYFSATVEPVTGHVGKEATIFVQLRNGKQVGISFNKADYDIVNNAGAAFNVQPGDIIKVFIVDDLTNASGANPVTL